MGTKIDGRKAGAGFSLIELAVVLVIAGILLGIGSASWNMIYATRKIAITRGELRKVRNCIVNRIVADGLYPSFTADLSNPDSRTVDYCLGGSIVSTGGVTISGKTDAWGGSIRYISGFAGNGTLAGECVLARPGVSSSDPCYTGLPPDVTSNASGFDGAGYQRVAFILVSFGSDGTADNTSSYGGLFALGDLAATMNTSPNQPNFRRLSKALYPNDFNTQDVELIVPYTELAAEIAKGRE
jgi:prepilin-type N-terminal cleavage/methylation domain-containing protein